MCPSSETRNQNEIYRTISKWLAIGPGPDLDAFFVGVLEVAEFEIEFTERVFS